MLKTPAVADISTSAITVSGAILRCCLASTYSAVATWSPLALSCLVDANEIIRGTLDDLEGLPRLEATAAPPQSAQRVPVGKRNDELFKYLRSIVGHCDDFDQLLDAANTWAADRLAAPVAEAEIARLREAPGVSEEEGGPSCST